ncbi:hypothetical protein GOP47_0012251 [Adiantum capillus-veneris]|uniref:Uncharacterized protein n=1 Tax=Adiantum capillus-veneris TaxID=13818 RepID=A0A9D4ZGB7_ADICA|nr:hypothetical protein GOP47_0012251 [Adiantum capillus-veneris]
MGGVHSFACKINRGFGRKMPPLAPGRSAPPPVGVPLLVNSLHTCLPRLKSGTHGLELHNMQ